MGKSGSLWGTIPIALIKNLLRILIAFSLFVLSLQSSACSMNTPAVENIRPSFLCVIVIDGVRPDNFLLTETPVLNQMAKEGASYNQAWVGQVKNVTPPVHLTISTGLFPKNNGVPGFGWKNPQDYRKWMVLTDWPSVSTGAFNDYIAQSGVTDIGALYKKAHPTAKVAVISSDKFYAAAGLGGVSADYILFNLAAGVNDYARTSGFAFALAGVENRLAPPEIMMDPSLLRKKSDPNDSDTWAVDITLKLMGSVKPEILLINLPVTDEIGHASGGISSPETMAGVMANVDKQIARVIDAYKKAGMYDRTIFVITSDHGMTPQMGTIPLNSFGSIIEKAGYVPAKQFQFDFPFPQKIAETAEAIARAKIPGVLGVYYKVQPENRTSVFLPAPTTLSSIPPDLDKAYRYLTSTYNMPAGPDIFLATGENWETDYETMAGNHNTPTWGNQHVPLIMAGPGVKKGVVLDSPARLVDIAPTVLAVMGIKPERMDGIVLADALTAATDVQTQQQALINAELSPMLKALQAQSAADIAAFKAAGTNIPAVTPAK